MELIGLSIALVIGFGAAFGLFGVLVSLCALYYSRQVIGLDERSYTGHRLHVALRARGSRIWHMLGRFLKNRPPLRAKASAAGIGPVIYACHPHGMLALGTFFAVVSGNLDRPGTRTVLVVHDLFWWLPFVRDLMLALGCIDRSWSSIENALANGFSVALLPGGIHEMGPPVTRPPAVLPLVRRVFSCGYAPAIVPVWCTNEDACCWIWHGEPTLLRRFRAWSQRKIGLSVGAFFLPRVWDWPVLQLRIDEPIQPAAFESAETLQACYTHRLFSLSEKT